MTTAVEDSARLKPMSTEAPGTRPSSAADSPIRVAEVATCRVPRPNTRRRMVTSRLNDSSKPMRNRRNTTPSSAMAPRPFSSEIGDPVERRNVARQRAQTVRAENGTGDKEAEDRAQLEALAQRHEDGRRREHDHRVAVDRKVGSLVHPRPASYGATVVWRSARRFSRSHETTMFPTMRHERSGRASSRRGA